MSCCFIGGIIFPTFFKHFIETGEWILICAYFAIVFLLLPVILTLITGCFCYHFNLDNPRKSNIARFFEYFEDFDPGIGFIIIFASLAIGTLFEPIFFLILDVFVK